ncbi:hypothetical protein BT96DRAFT_925668 [Gymnopus androsaceus JB14]|uniref:ASST-domain-containing protein n=1 Tax=Gymnopus androsaceus JB14 TaxID=1447944 RepID=A0A6A4GZ74_9AGAR|nr:hypothetical protein BT96DRAFT_925668 [Gymnopus androsaceus JB14]
MLSSLSASIFLSLFLARHARASVAFCNDLDYESGALGLSPSQTYNAAPFSPVQINYALAPSDCPANSQVEGYFFYSPQGVVAMPGGGLIMNPNGTMVYFAAGFGQSSMRGLQEYEGADHLAIWVGDGSPVTGGHGSGYNLLLDNTYSVVANVTVTNLGTGADVHELQITPNKTAVMTAYPTQEADLTAFGGPNPGYLLNCAAQEVDITTGEAVFTWQALDHVDPSECFAAIGEAGTGTVDDPWDYFHINSIQKNDDGNYLISSRHCHTLYLVNPDGDIIWRMGGMNSNFTFGPGANYTWQHHARIHNSSTLSVFNNGASEFDQDFPFSQGLLLNYDDSAMTVSLINARSPFDPGDSIVGWGAIPYYSQHDTDGNILWSVQFGLVPDSAYRVFLHDWIARPTTPPSIQVSNTSSSGNVTVYAWWNGATEVTAWQLLGSTADEPMVASPLIVADKLDFETVLTYTGDDEYAYFQVAAMNADGKILGFSDFTSLNGTITFVKADNQTVTAASL